MSDAARIVLVFLLVFGNAIFVAAEYALVTARRGRLEERAELGGRGARAALDLIDEPVRFISSVQVGITVFGIALGAVGEPLVSRYLDFLPRGVAFLVSFIVLTYLSVTLGELVPEGDRVAEGRAAWRSPSRTPISSALADRLSRSCGCSTTRRTPSSGLLSVKPAPAGMIAYTREGLPLQRGWRPKTSGSSHEAPEETLYKVFDFC